MKTLLRNTLFIIATLVFTMASANTPPNEALLDVVPVSAFPGDLNLAIPNQTATFQIQNTFTAPLPVYVNFTTFPDALLVDTGGTTCSDTTLLAVNQTCVVQVVESFTDAYLGQVFNSGSIQFCPSQDNPDLCVALTPAESQNSMIVDRVGPDATTITANSVNLTMTSTQKTAVVNVTNTSTTKAAAVSAAIATSSPFAGQISIDPSSVTIPVGGSQLFTVTLTGTGPSIGAQQASPVDFSISGAQTNSLQVKLNYLPAAAAPAAVTANAAAILAAASNGSGTLTFTNNSPNPVTLDQATINGVASNVDISSDTCSSQIIQPTETCTLTLTEVGSENGVNENEGSPSGWVQLSPTTVGYFTEPNNAIELQLVTDATGSTASPYISFSTSSPSYIYLKNVGSTAIAAGFYFSPIASDPTFSQTACTVAGTGGTGNTCPALPQNGVAKIAYTFTAGVQYGNAVWLTMNGMNFNKFYIPAVFPGAIGVLPPAPSATSGTGGVTLPFTIYNNISGYSLNNDYVYVTIPSELTNAILTPVTTSACNGIAFEQSCTVDLSVNPSLAVVALATGTVSVGYAESEPPNYSSYITQEVTAGAVVGTAGHVQLPASRNSGNVSNNGILATDGTVVAGPAMTSGGGVDGSINGMVSNMPANNLIFGYGSSTYLSNATSGSSNYALPDHSYWFAMNGANGFISFSGIPSGLTVTNIQKMYLGCADQNPGTTCNGVMLVQLSDNSSQMFSLSFAQSSVPLNEAPLSITATEWTLPIAVAGEVISDFGVNQNTTTGAMSSGLIAFRSFSTSQISSSVYSFTLAGDGVPTFQRVGILTGPVNAITCAPTNVCYVGGDFAIPTVLQGLAMVYPSDTTPIFEAVYGFDSGTVYALKYRLGVLLVGGESMYIEGIGNKVFAVDNAGTWSYPSIDDPNVAAVLGIADNLGVDATSFATIGALYVIDKNASGDLQEDEVNIDALQLSWNKWFRGLVNAQSTYNNVASLITVHALYAGANPIPPVSSDKKKQDEKVRPQIKFPFFS